MPEPVRSAHASRDDVRNVVEEHRVGVTQLDAASTGKAGADAGLPGVEQGGDAEFYPGSRHVLHRQLRRRLPSGRHTRGTPARGATDERHRRTLDRIMPTRGNWPLPGHRRAPPPPRHRRVRGALQQAPAVSIPRTTGTRPTHGPRSAHRQGQHSHPSTRSTRRPHPRILAGRIGRHGFRHPQGTPASPGAGLSAQNFCTYSP